MPKSKKGSPAFRGIVSHMRSEFDHEISSRLSGVAELRKALGALRKIEKDGKLTFLIEIENNWKNEGGKDVKVRHRGSLKAGMKKAIDAFLADNNRSDVQGVYRVYAVVVRNWRKKLATRHLEFTVPVPEEYWESYRHVAQGSKA
jgi:hypothetical protein